MKIRQVICSFLLSASLAGGIHAQNTKPSVTADTTTPPSNLGFSIESEMLTYRAVEADSVAIGCDVGRYLYGEEDATCPFTPHGGAPSGLVLVSSGSTTLADFQLWRQDMSRMKTLESRADVNCSTRRGLAPNQALSLVHDTMALFANTETTSSVQGTVKDQALLNAVARELRAANVPVLTPELYNPFDLGPADLGQSPYFQNLEVLFEKRRDCKESKTHAGADVEEIGFILDQIDAFVSGLTGQNSSSEATPLQSDATKGSSGQGVNSTGPSANAANGSNPTAPITTPQNKTASVPDQSILAAAAAHFTSVFRADGFAKALGFRPNGEGPSPMWQHVLWLKALESGGTVTNEGNILGSKVRYSGGAVATYALFSLDGTLDCSANVYSYGGRLRTKEFLESFADQGPESKSKAVMPSSACRHVH